MTLLLDDGTGTFPYDITAYVRTVDGWKLDRGREDELSTTTPGTFGVVLDNTDGRFTPGSTLIATPSPIVCDQRIRFMESVIPGTFETDVGGVSAWTGSNATLLQVTTPVRTGSAAMRMTAVASADMSGASASGTSGYPVVPGQAMLLSGYFRTAVTVRNCFVRVRFYDSAGGLISTVDSPSVADSTSAWTQAKIATTAPALAAYAGVTAVVSAPVAGEQHYVDDLTLSIYRHTGYVQSWPVTWPTGSDLESRCAIAAMDAQARATRRILRSVVEEESALDSPAVEYLLAEPAGAATASDSSGNQSPVLVMGGTGTDVVFGSATGPPTDGLTAAVFAGKYLTVAGLTYPDPNYVMEIFFSTSIAAGVLIGTSTSGSSATTLLGIDAGGHLSCPILALASTATAVDGNTHHAGLKVDTNANQTTLWLDGVQVASSGSIIGAPAAGTFQFTLGVGFAGTLAYAAFYRSALADARILAHATAGSTGFAGESDSARLTRLAGYANIPVGTLDTSLTNVAFVEFTGQNATDAINDVVTAEFGSWYTNASGAVDFHNRNKVVAKTAPDITIDANYLAEDTAFTTDMQGVLNYYEVTASTGITQVVRNAVSESGNGTSVAHGRYSGSASYLVQTDAEALDRGNWTVANHAQPAARVGSLTFDLLTMSAVQQHQFMTVEADTWIRITGLPGQTPGSTTADFIVQGIAEAGAIGSSSGWALTCNVVNQSLFSPVWILDNTTYSVLGSTTRLYV